MSIIKNTDTLGISIIESDIQLKLADDYTISEPPIFGAPLFFELIRSLNINGNQNALNINRVNIAVNQTNSFDSSLNLCNPTKYEGFFYRKAGLINFVRNSIISSNPYIFLTESDIKQNAEDLEEKFTTISNTSLIKNSISEYWNRLGEYNKLINFEKANKINFDAQEKYLGYYPNMHLIYAYMMENTKIVQIFEKIIMLYQNGEDLTIPMNGGDLLARPWLDNTHSLFYSNSPNSIWNENSLLGSNFEAMRRNAYHREFGLDLNHGIGEKGTTPVIYPRANHYNEAFVSQIENFLKLCWQTIINYSNTSSVNTTDLIALQEQSNTIKNMLLARRTNLTNLDNYTFLNLSKIEYSSVVMMKWLHHAISYNSPIVKEMGAEGVTSSERLSRLGQRVNISCHSKTGNFIDLAPLMATLLRMFELDEVDNNFITSIAHPNTIAYALVTTILHNYQLATGKDLKNQVMFNNNSKSKLATAYI